MLKSIGIGTELFHNLIEKDSYYVDKTPFIRTVFKENNADVMLITRPRPTEKPDFSPTRRILVSSKVM